jgi:hypothetical protein
MPDRCLSVLSVIGQCCLVEGLKVARDYSE